MGIFTRKVRKKHIEQFGYKISELLKSEMPQLTEAMSLSKLYGISFLTKPEGIYLSHGYTPKNFELINRNHRTSFNLTGISVFSIKENGFRPVKLYFLSDNLTQIEVNNPQYFHKDFDLNQIQKTVIEVENLPLVNPDQKIAEEALRTLSKEQQELLELDYSFEIELDGKLYYTILDMEDGNYMAVDKSGKIYRLAHDDEEQVKVIAKKPLDFFEIYHGQKSELDRII